jgi:membrane associated rhomboid family serine protease
MSETELSVICKNCGSEVSPYVTECPYCGTRLRKRAPKLERRDGALEAQRPRRRRWARPRRAAKSDAPRPFRPYATLAAILGSAGLLLVQQATGNPLSSFGGLVIPFDDQWWRLFVAPFAYYNLGYMFVVALALAIFATGVERRLGSWPTAVLLIASGTLGMLAASGVANAQDQLAVIAGGNGMALGALAAWFAIRRAESRRTIAEEYDMIGVVVCAAVLIALPLFAETADLVAGLVGGVVGGLAGLVAVSVRPAD